MYTELTNCPNCNLKLKEGLLSSVLLLTEGKTKIINEFHSEKSTAYCNKCGTELYEKYKLQLLKERNKKNTNLQHFIDAVPVVSTHSPLNWDYEILSMVTGQSTTGTGVISEFTSSFTDLFGVQSGRLNRKLKGGEDLCFAQLRKQTLDLGGNAVIATDIDYSEVGGGKGILMVCMGGTAINLKNPTILGQDRADKIDSLSKLNTRLNFLYSLYSEDD
jgi:uncharacterized protein YbjQ (UPF0145 family)